MKKKKCPDCESTDLQVTETAIRIYYQKTDASKGRFKLADIDYYCKKCNKEF